MTLRMANTVKAFSKPREIVGGLGLGLCLLLTGRDDDYTTAVRRAVSENGGVEQTRDVLLERARAGEGRDVYLYYHFLTMYVPTDPGPEFQAWPHKTEQDKDAILNCAAEAGFVPAQREVAGRVLPSCPLF